MIFITKRNQFNQTKGVYHEKNVIFIIRMFYHFYFCRMQFFKERFCRSYHNAGNCNNCFQYEEYHRFFYLWFICENDSYDFSAYKKRIKKLTKKVNNAKSSSNASVNEKRFYTLKKELDVVDDELDHLDDEFEHTYENGKLSFKTYKSREKTIEKLEDQLDLLEDALENKFGIDDWFINNTRDCPILSLLFVSSYYSF